MKFTLALLFLISAACTLSASAAKKDPGHKPECKQTTPEQNRQLALYLFNKLINEQDFSGLEEETANLYVQHNPWFRDGYVGFMEDMKPMLEAGTPRGSVTILNSIAAGDYVWVHSSLPVNGTPHVFADIWKFECGQMVEHWDVIQEMVPSKINDHAYF